MIEPSQLPASGDWFLHAESLGLTLTALFHLSVTDCLRLWRFRHCEMFDLAVSKRIEHDRCERNTPVERTVNRY